MSPCHGCHAGCCRAFAVPVTGADVLRLERDLGLGFWQLACRWEDRDGTISAGVVPQLHFDDDPDVPYVLSLLHEPSRNFPRTTKCRFLVEEPPTQEFPLGRANCSVYESRPLACRVFPTKLSDTGALAVLRQVPTHGRANDESPAYDLCPRQWDVADVDPVSAVPDLIVLQFELKFFQQVAVMWNRSPGRWLDFPQFLRLVYEHRVQPSGDDRAAETGSILKFPTAADDTRPDAIAA